MMGNIKGYFNPYPEELGNSIICDLSGGGVRVFTCKADTADITRLPSQSISVLANAINGNCQTKIKIKS